MYPGARIGVLVRVCCESYAMIVEMGCANDDLAGQTVSR